ncbi:hypothetical protein [Streptomyces sp. NPDC096324]|uniref:hypothetical protein n=1 Tax=Streptomyces sp. NPDC096324 TaxID=3366085 RepID=UPI0037F817AA
MPKKRRATVPDWLLALGCIAFALDLGDKAFFDSSAIVRAGAIFALVVLAFSAGIVFGRLQERRKPNSQGPQTPLPDISA